MTIIPHDKNGPSEPAAIVVLHSARRSAGYAENLRHERNPFHPLACQLWRPAQNPDRVPNQFAPRVRTLRQYYSNHESHWSRGEMIYSHPVMSLPGVFPPPGCSPLLRVDNVRQKKPRQPAGPLSFWLWKKDSNLHGAVSSSAMCGGQPQSDPILVGAGITLCLSRIPTPETRGHVCQISSLHILAIQPGPEISFI